MSLLPHILVVDDDTRLRGLLSRYLAENGFTVVTARDAADARAKLACLKFDLAVVDVMMPGEDGLSLTRDLRAARDLPILLLTALAETGDRIKGLESGADDYLTKPFEPRELLLRIEAILRRRAPPPPPPARLGRWRFDAARGELVDGAEVQRLTGAEAQLLSVLAAAPGQVFSREELSEETGAEGNVRAIDVQVTRLRRKIEDDPRQPRYLLTVRGQGYVLRPD